MINGIGDIFALIQFTNKVIARLRASRHAPEEIRQLIADVEAFELYVTQASQSIQSHGTVLRPNDALRNQIVLILKRCETTTENLSAIVTTYESVLKEEAAASGDEQSRSQWNRSLERLRRLYRSITWTTIQEAVEDLRSQFRKNMKILQYVTQQISNRQIDLMFEILCDWTSRVGPMPPIPSSPPLLSINTQPETSLSSTPPATPANPFTGSPRPEAFAMEPPELPPTPIDLNNWISRHDLDSEMFNPGDQYRHIQLATRMEQEDFIRELSRSAQIIEIPVESVEFVYWSSHTSQSVPILASDRGRVLLLSRFGAIEEIWTMNDKRTIRFVQKLEPCWDPVIPYSANGENSRAVVEQGPGLTFVTFEYGRQVFHSIPTTWVTYEFGNEDDCKRFQECLYGWDLELTVPVSQIYRPRHIRDDEHLVGVQNIRVWKSRPTGSSEMKFMARLSRKPGRKKYLEFDLCQETIRSESSRSGREYKLTFSGINACIDEMGFEKRESSSSLSSVPPARSISSSFKSRRFSRDHSSLLLDRIVIVFGQRNHRDQLLALFNNCRSG